MSQADTFGLLTTWPPMQTFLKAIALAKTDADIASFMTWHAVLFTDLSGFSVHPMLVEALKRVVQMEKAIAALTQLGGGMVLKSLGDSFLILFDTVGQAVDAVDLLRAALPVNAFCAGIGYGPMVVCQHRAGRHDAFGFAVSEASRLGEDIATGRQCLLTPSAYAAVSAAHQQRCVAGEHQGLAYWDMRTILNGTG